MAAAPRIFQFIGEQVDTALNTYVASTSSQVITDITPIALSLTTLYFVLMGYMMIAGRIQQPMSEFLVQAVKFLLIAGVALSAGNYMSWVVESVHGLENGLTAAFSAVGSGEPQSVYATVDESLGKGWGIAGDLWEKASNRGVTELSTAIGEYINATIIAFATLIVGLPAGAIIVIAKAGLTLMLGIGPFFVASLMWSATAKWFDAWFGQVMTFVLTIALVAAVVSFTVKIFDAFVGGVNLESDQSPLFTALSLLVLSSVMLGLLYKTAGIAAQLAGGVAASVLTFGQMASTAMSPVRSAANTINPTSTRLDPRTGHQTASSRLEHVAQGRSVFVPNPAYRQAVMERFSDSWSPGQNAIKPK